MFPPINSHSRPPSEDLRANTNGELNSTSKQNSTRRQQQQQQTIEQHRRSPMRSNSLVPTTATRYLSAAAAAAAATAVQIPTESVSSLARSPSFVQTGSAVQFEPAKSELVSRKKNKKEENGIFSYFYFRMQKKSRLFSIHILKDRKTRTTSRKRAFSFLVVYRTTDFAWNDHPSVTNHALRASSPLKKKLSTSARHITNGNLHESTAAIVGNSTLHIQSSSVSPQQHYSREDMNNSDMLVASAAKSRQTSRLQRTNSYLDKSPGTAVYGLPIRSESYRSSRLDYGPRSRHTSSKQRNYSTSKTSSHDVNNGDFYLNSAQDENIYYYQQQQQQQQLNYVNTTQRLNGSSFDLTASRKPLSPNRSSTFNVPVQHGYYNSSHELHRSDTNLDRNQLARLPGRSVTSKEPVVSTSKYRHQSGAQSNTTTAASSATPAERHPSAQSYKSRDPNISYAYTDVKKYIEENELMSPEKEQIIRNWVLDVEKHRHQLQKID